MQQMFGPRNVNMFGLRNVNIKPKVKVEPALNDDTLTTGIIFISPSARIHNTLNDSSPFLTFEHGDEWLSVLNKRTSRNGRQRSSVLPDWEERDI